MPLPADTQSLPLTVGHRTLGAVWLAPASACVVGYSTQVLATVRGDMFRQRELRLAEGPHSRRGRSHGWLRRPRHRDRRHLRPNRTRRSVAS